MSSSASRLSRPGTAGSFQQLTEIALSGDRNGFVDAVERVGVSAMMERDENGNTLLHVVAATGDLKMIKLLLRLGVALDSMNDCHQTASIVAENCGHVAISEYLNRKLREIQPDAAAVALDNDAPVNEDDAAHADNDFQKEYLDAVLNYAIVIGIDAMNEPHLLHIAEEGLGAPLPAEWREQDGVYYNVNTSQTQRDHPNDEVFKQRVVNARARGGGHDEREHDQRLPTPPPPLQQQQQQQPATFDAAGAAEDEEGEYDEDFEDVAPLAVSHVETDKNDERAAHDGSVDGVPASTDCASKLLDPVLDADATRTMMLLQERLKLRTRDMERYGRQTHRAASPDFVPHTMPFSGSIYGQSSPAKYHKSSGAPDNVHCASSSAHTSGVSAKDSKSEFDRLMKRYMGFSSTQAALTFEDRRQRQLAVKEAIKDIQAKHNNVNTSLRQFLDSKAAEKAATRQLGTTSATNNAPAATLPVMPNSQKARQNTLRPPQLSSSPLQACARPANNPWILQRKFTMLFDPQHMKPSKAGSVYAPPPPALCFCNNLNMYSKIKPVYMEGRNLQSPSVCVSLYPSISPNRMSDDNDPFAFVLDPRRRHKLIAKQTARSDRSQCASPWSPELKKSGVWDKNGYLDCNAFLFGDKYVHYSRQTVRQMDLDDELKRKGVQKAEELLWPNPDPYRHIKRGT